MAGVKGTHHAHRPTVSLVSGDWHIPYHDKRAVEVFCRVVEHVKPDISVSLGDVLDCSQFSAYPPTYRMPETEYEDDITEANRVLDRIGAASEELVLVEGNHEYRLDRWAAATREGKGSYASLAPRHRLTKGRKCRYIPYDNLGGTYPHFRLNSRISVLHGWSYAKHATKNHLALSQGRSIIHGHTHRVDMSLIQDVWSPGHIVQSRSAGCLCQLVPLYRTSSPVEWCHAFILAYLGRRSDSLYTVPIIGNRCILPDGTEIAA